jgi:MFS family permease
MSFLMTVTPIAMKDCNFTFGDSAIVIQGHVLGMFAPSFVTGHIIRRIGERNVLLLGVCCYAVTFGAGMAGVDIVNFWVALVLLGLGWNFLYVGGTSLLTKCYTPSERAKVQGFNDFLTFSGVAACSLVAGAIEQTLGWDFVLWGSLAPTVIILGAVLWGAPRHRPSR